MCQRDLRLELPIPNRASFAAISEGHPGALNLLTELAERSEDMIIILSHLDSKHLYGIRLYELFVKVCDSDIDRFLYHLMMELPCQLGGEMTFCGPHMAGMSTEQLRTHGQARQFGKPNSFWALENPPQTPDYEYPIVAEVATA